MPDVPDRICSLVKQSKRILSKLYLTTAGVFPSPRVNTIYRHPYTQEERYLLNYLDQNHLSP